MAVTTVGQVVTTGQQLVVVTPHAGRLQVEALVANLDIGFVKLGQKAAIKVDAFPFTRFGVLNGKVVEIASARFRNRKLSERSPMQPLPPVRRRRRRPLLGNPKASSFPSRSHWMRPR
jgi:hypothetical protein